VNPNGITAPKITAPLMRQALATRAGVVVQDATTGAVYALPQGMTKLQSMDGNLVVVLTNDEAESYVTAAAGNYGQAARTATTVLAWEIDTIESRLTAAAQRVDR
jgi:hypothetical protein